MDYETILLSVEDGIGRITMNNPKTLNALSGKTICELSDAIDKLERDNTVRIVIITGEGKAFVAGADISYMANLTPEQARIFAYDTTDIYQRMSVSSKIFIAAVNGFALGGGCELALACDLRIASERARFGLPEVSLGILPGGGGTQRLSRLVGVQKAKEMILTGNAIRASEALQIGLVCKVVEPDDLMDAAYDMAKDIVVNAPLAVKYARECIQKSQCSDLRSGIEFENAMFGLCFATPDQKEGMQAFLEKRKADFQNHL